ncbi:uncharacterized protein ARMOST_02390 [Armillaria ostoyae]|uniref:C2H2-type domain-containing protein n=1 Tax=Armillaria ostoyae TaxID=47428 RepID=A0A284QRJ0_ARMOS|nr:uncharacterized protein ARMOST_02390 [Armillaria ostoyae]
MPDTDPDFGDPLYENPEFTDQMKVWDTFSPAASLTTEIKSQGSSMIGSKSTSRSALPRRRRADANMGSLADHGSLLQGTSSATYRGVSNLEDWDIYYPYFESEAEALLGSDTTAGRTASLSLMDSLLPGPYISQHLSTFLDPGAGADFAGYSSTERQHHETAYIPVAHRCLEQEARLILPRSTPPSASNFSNVDWSEVENSSNSFGERNECSERTADFSFYAPPKIRIYKCPYLSCDFESRSYRGLCGHKSVHTIGIFPCPKCGVVFFRSKAFNGHVKVHKNPNDKCKQAVQKYSCLACEKKFVHKRSLEAHESKKHASYAHHFNRLMSTY